MNSKGFFTALMLAAVPVMGMAQIGAPLNCDGLVGGAMAQCIQGMGSSRASVVTPRQPSPAPAVRETARSGADPKDASAGSGISSIGASIGSAFSGLFSGWDSSPRSKGSSCQGLVGGAMSQCLQGMSSGTGGAGSGSDAGSTADAGDNAFSNVKTNMNFGNNSLKCDGLAGGAMAQCLQTAR